MSEQDGQYDVDATLINGYSRLALSNFMELRVQAYRPGSLGVGRWSDSGCPAAGRCCPRVEKGTAPTVQEGGGRPVD